MRSTDKSPWSKISIPFRYTVVWLGARFSLSIQINLVFELVFARPRPLATTAYIVCDAALWCSRTKLGGSLGMPCFQSCEDCQSCQTKSRPHVLQAMDSFTFTQRRYLNSCAWLGADADRKLGTR